jgi:hypothetical protein
MVCPPRVLSTRSGEGVRLSSRCAVVTNSGPTGAAPRFCPETGTCFGCGASGRREARWRGAARRIDGDRGRRYFALRQRNYESVGECLRCREVGRARSTHCGGRPPGLQAQGAPRAARLRRLPLFATQAVKEREPLPAGACAALQRRCLPQEPAPFAATAHGAAPGRQAYPGNRHPGTCESQRGLAPSRDASRTRRATPAPLRLRCSPARELTSHVGAIARSGAGHTERRRRS